MNKVRLLPVVILAVAALLVLKTFGLVTHGGYVLTGVAVAQAAGGGGEAAPAPQGEPTLTDTSPTLDDAAPTLGASAGQGGHGAPAAEPAVAAAAPAAATSSTYCIDADVTLTEAPVLDEEDHGAEGEAAPEQFEADPASFAQSMSVGCLPSGDAVPAKLGAGGTLEPLINADGSTATEQQILERLAARRGELEKYEQDLAVRGSLVDAAEKRIEERQAALEALEAQISTLVDQRKEMEAGQFAGIVAMYEAMKPKDAANIFNSLDMPVLLRVAKSMQPRKMAPVLAEMQPARAQELTVAMADLSDRPPEQMPPDDLAALPQIVGQ